MILVISRIAQIMITVLLVFLVVIQSKGTGLSSSFGGNAGAYRSRRGLEKGIFGFTIALGVLLVVNSLVLLLFN